MASSAAWAIATALSSFQIASSIKVKQSDAALWLEEMEKPTPGDCGRGFDCGYTVSSKTVPPTKLPCPGGDRYFAHNTIVLRGRNGESALYCPVPKVATSYIFNVMEELKLPYEDGPRNSGYASVNTIYRNATGLTRVHCEQEPTGEICQKAIAPICNAATSMVVIRNPWDRVASAYVDKVLTKETFRNPPAFDEFWRTLTETDQTYVNQHFKSLSQTCSTSGEDKQIYDMVIRIEDDLPGKLHELFVNKLGLPEDEVTTVLNSAEEHTSEQKHAFDSVDKSIEAGIDRTTYYFQQTDPSLASKVYADDIEFGHYTYEEKWNEALLEMVLDA